MTARRGYNPPIDYGRPAQQGALDILDRWEQGDLGLLRDRRSFWLSNAYYHDEQWVNYDERTGLVESLLQRGQDTQRTRSTHNLIRANINTLMGKFLGAPITFEIPVSSPDDSSLSAAKIGEHLLESLRIEQDWEDLRKDELFDALMGGTSAVWVDWDDEGQRRDQHGKIHYDGNVKLGTASIAEFTVQPGVRRSHDAYWWILGLAHPVEQVREDYDLSWTPTPDANGKVHGPLQRRLLSERGYDVNLDLCNVFILYERPNSEHPKGRIQHMVNEQIVKESDWHFPFEDRLNLYVFRQDPISGRWNGDTFMNSARQIQLVLNGVESIIDEHAKRAGVARLMAPYGSLDDNTILTDEPGEIINYNSGYGLDDKPFYLAAPAIPRWLYQRGDYLRGRLDAVMHVTDILRGEAPGDRNSGAALGILGERAETALGPTARDQAKGWSTIGSLVLQLLADKVPDERTSTATINELDQDVQVDITWNGRTIEGVWNVHVPLDSMMPRSRAQRHAQALNYINAGIIPKDNPHIVGKMLELGPNYFRQTLDPDAARAQRENYRISMDTILIPEEWDDHPRHIAEHNAFRKSIEYERMTAEQREILDLHILAHERLEWDQAQQQRELNAMMPGLGATPQANAPTGSAIPMPIAQERLALQAAAANRPGPAPTALPAA